MTKAFDCAIRLLSRREHGSFELANKLAQKGYCPIEIREVINKCQHLGWQNDARFVELFCQTRIRQGYGPLKINQELQAKQIDKELIEAALKQEQDNWLSYALAVWRKKYKNHNENTTYVERQKRQRFLLSRGFPGDIIAKVVAEAEIE